MGASRAPKPTACAQTWTSKPMGLQPVVDAWLIFRRNSSRNGIVLKSIVGPTIEYSKLWSPLSSPPPFSLFVSSLFPLLPSSGDAKVLMRCCLTVGSQSGFAAVCLVPSGRGRCVVVPYPNPGLSRRNYCQKRCLGQLPAAVRWE